MPPPPRLDPPPFLQARVPGVDGDAAAGHGSAVLCARQHARLHCLHEPGLRLEQEGGRRRAQQLLLGLLPDSGCGRTPGGPVTTPSPDRAQAALGGGWAGQLCREGAAGSERGQGTWPRARGLESEVLTGGGQGRHPTEAALGASEDRWTGWTPLSPTLGLLSRGLF